MRVSRRTTLAMLGGAAVAGGGIALVAPLSDEDLVHAVLERHLGELLMDRADIAAFLADFRLRQPWVFPSTKLTAVYGVAERLDLADLIRKVLPAEPGEDIVQFERHLLGEFHARTDVAFRSSPQDPVTYLGSGACMNPFAEFG